AARAGAAVSMVGRVGNDGFAALILEKLHAAGVDTRFVSADPERSTGVADILVDAQGQNSIVVVPEANGALSGDHVDEAFAALEDTGVVLLQLEIPLATVIHAAARARTRGARVILNPAPATPLPPALVASVDLIVPNQIEARELTGIDATTVEGGRAAATALVGQGYPAAVVTMGESGAFFAEAGTPATHIAGHVVDVVDTTAAGDAFCGAMAAALAGGATLADAVRVGNAAGALACQRLGAEPSLPSRVEIDRLLSG
ncbi:MAG: bifunctional hydroxymethylpyrimidine kinase/phosphomethylpyrimidine kinase, partial [Myxococcales bacterium]|nr:bifunctional hydroxymethylpyrimidine kinase/phosphomethylpyrimidine kinase [Myxococcales bacterium]